MRQRERGRDTREGGQEGEEREGKIGKSVGNYVRVGAVMGIRRLSSGVRGVS